MNLAKQKKTQQFCMKLNSSFLAKYNWDLNLPVEEARKTPGVIISLADSQILTWINELNGTEDFDEKAKAIKREIKQIKKEKSSKENKKRIKDLYSNLYKIQLFHFELKRNLFYLHCCILLIQLVNIVRNNQNDWF